MKDRLQKELLRLLAVGNLYSMHQRRSFQVAASAIDGEDLIGLGFTEERLEISATFVGCYNDSHQVEDMIQSYFERQRLLT